LFKFDVFAYSYLQGRLFYGITIDVVYFHSLFPIKRSFFMMHYKHHSPAVRLICKISWLLTSIGALAWGLLALGESMGKDWNIWTQPWMMPSLVQPLQYLIGLAGLVGLISWFMCLGHKHDGK
jgi:uncharacterized membrane protein YuzA (DUF378 family)